VEVCRVEENRRKGEGSNLFGIKDTMKSLFVGPARQAS
jgi:hypothetical protein